MTRFLRSIFLLIAAITAAGAMAQTDPLLSQHFAVPTLYNPAAAGSTELLRLRAGGRLQWVGVEHAPTTFLGTADMPLTLLGKRIGVGATVMHDSEGLYSGLRAGVQAAYKIKLLGGTLSAGVQLGLFDQGFKGSEVVLPDDDDFHQGTDDGIPTTDVHGTAFDFGAGIFYTHKYFNAGVSCTHLGAPTVTLETTTGGSTSSGRAGEGASGAKVFEFKARRTLYFQGEGNIPVKNTLFDILPSVIVASDFTFTSAVVNARARYRKFLSIGVGYRWNDAVTVTLGAEFRNFFVGYSFDYSTAAIAKASSGSHELFLGYSLKINNGDKNKNKHKSIRIM
ncbi:MAG: PorP/SprF family type IX secretion system membrane protein [Muribaculaceae bacterium]|nr:PorP/SprF family type IX secretion system membrane protein [Muribaculaceae bacterium]